MKAIIYYSLSGHTKKEVESRYEGDFFPLKGKIKIPKRYFFQLAYLGMFASMNKDLQYDSLDLDLEKYDEVVLATPVWAWNITPFIKKFLKDYPIKNKKVTLLITHAGGPGKVMKRFSKKLDSSNTIVDKISIESGMGYKEANILRKSKKQK